MNHPRRRDQTMGRPKRQFSFSIASARQLQMFNDSGEIPVDFDIMRSTIPQIELIGNQAEIFSLWETRTASGFVSKPKFNADLVTVRFVTNGHIVYRHGSGDSVGSPTAATLMNFEDLREAQASRAFAAVSATIAVEALVVANLALTGNDNHDLHALAPVTDVTTPGLKALFETMRLAQRRSQAEACNADLVLTLMKEIISYQLLASWPKRVAGAPPRIEAISSYAFQAARDYIHANLSTPLTLADIAAAAGISVRSLQNKFRQEIQQTPVQYIIEQRLQGAHRDLVGSENDTLTVADIARRWGFVHMSDFGRRYRSSYGCPPSETRRDIARGR